MGCSSLGSSNFPTSHSPGGTVAWDNLYGVATERIVFSLDVATYMYFLAVLIWCQLVNELKRMFVNKNNTSLSN